MSASYRLRVRELEQERAANERLRLQTLIMAKAIHECGGTMDHEANAFARSILGMNETKANYYGRLTNGNSIASGR